MEIRSESDCTTPVVEQDLILLHLGALGAEQADDIRAHLQTCGSCGERYRKVQSVLEREADCSTQEATGLDSQTSSFYIDRSPATHKTGVAHQDDMPTATRFERRELLGRGGYGSVYRMFDFKLGREVAVKVPLFKIDGDARARRRFEREVEATARLRHPYIVPLHDFVLNDDEAMLIHELIEGKTLAQWITEHPSGADPKVAAEIVHRLAFAIDHAHSHKVLHRDIKPSNVLLDFQQPDGALPFHPRLADFGVAKILHDETITESHHHFVGSIHYASPEVVLNSADAHMPASDIYSLGVVLYELLTGSKAFPGTTIADVFRMIAYSDFVPPRSIRPAIPRDLEAICLRCMSFRPRDRYLSAAELAEDLQRFLNGKPVVARHPSRVETTLRSIRRHPTRAAVALLGTAAVAVILALQSVNNRTLSKVNRLLEQRNSQLSVALESAREQLFHNEQAAYADHMVSVFEDVKQNKLRDARTLLNLYKDGQAKADHRDFEWHYARQLINRESQVLWKGEKSLYCFATIQNNLAVSGADGRIQIIDGITGRSIHQWDAGQVEVNSLAVAPSRSHLYSSGDDGSLACFKLPDGELVWRCKAFEAERAYDMAYDLGRSRIFCISHLGTLAAVDASSGERVEKWNSPKTDGACLALINEDTIVVGTNHGKLVFVDANAGEVLFEHELGPYQKVSSLAFDKKLNRLFIAIGYSLIVFDVSKRQVVGSLATPDQAISVFHEDSSNTYMVAMTSGVIHRYRIGDENEIQVVDGWVNDATRLFAITTSPDDKHVLTLDANGEVRRWQTKSEAKRSMFATEDTRYLRFDFLDTSPTGNWPTLLINTTAGLQLIDLENGSRQTLFEPAQDISSVKNISATQSLIGPMGEPAMLIEHPARVSEMSPTPRKRPLSELAQTCFSYSSDGRLIAGCDGPSNHTWVADIEFKEVTRLPGSARTVFVADKINRVFWNDYTQLLSRDLQGSEPIQVLASFAGVPCCLAMTKDQGKLAIMLSDREVHLWDAKKNVPIGPIMMHPGSVRLVQFSDDEKTLFTFDQDGTLRCWNVATGKLTLVVPNPCDEPIALTGISKDGRFHAFVTETNSLHVYRRF